MLLPPDYQINMQECMPATSQTRYFCQTLTVDKVILNVFLCFQLPPFYPFIGSHVTKSSYVAEAGLEFLIFSSPKCWDYRKATA